MCRGALLIAASTAAEPVIRRGPIIIRGVGFDIHAILYTVGATILGLHLDALDPFSRG